MLQSTHTPKANTKVIGCAKTSYRVRRGCKRRRITPSWSCCQSRARGGPRPSATVAPRCGSDKRRLSRDELLPYGADLRYIGVRARSTCRGRVDVAAQMRGETVMTTATHTLRDPDEHPPRTAAHRAARMRPSPPWDSRAETSRCRPATRNSSWVHDSARARSASRETDSRRVGALRAGSGPAPRRPGPGPQRRRCGRSPQSGHL